MTGCTYIDCHNIMCARIWVENDILAYHLIKAPKWNINWHSGVKLCTFELNIQESQMFSKLSCKIYLHTELLLFFSIPLPISYFNWGHLCIRMSWVAMQVACQRLIAWFNTIILIRNIFMLETFVYQYFHSFPKRSIYLLCKLMKKKNFVILHRFLTTKNLQITVVCGGELVVTTTNLII